jgi:hypothetical protein
MRRRGLLLALVLSLAGVAHAAEWNAIRPGASTQDDVRAQFGQPTRVTSQKVEGYDTGQWLYEGAQAPRGASRLTVDFGILTPQGYKANVVRAMTLIPKPGIFTREAVLTAWGQPEGAKTEGGVPSILYHSGLIVMFDKEGNDAISLTFTPSQQPSAAPGRR